MSKRNQRKGITVANLISGLGFTVFTIASFLGYYLLRGGDMFEAAILTLVNLVVAILLISVIYKAKTAENDTRKWLIVEIVCMVAFLVFCIVWASKPILHTGSVMLNKDALVNAVKEDEKAITNMLTAYSTDRQKAIGKMMDNSVKLKNYSDLKIESGSIDILKNINLVDKESPYVLNPKKSNYDGYNDNSAAWENRVTKNFNERENSLKEDANTELIAFEQLKAETAEKLANIQNSIANLDIFSFHNNAVQLEELNKHVAEKLNELAERDQMGIFFIELALDTDGRTTMVKCIPYSRSYSPASSLVYPKLLAAEISSDESSKINYKGSLTALGIAIVAVSIIMMLCTYFFAYRSLSSGPQRGSASNDGGVDLFE